MKANNQRGFSLLEILIAFSILALSLGILLNIFSQGLNNTGVAEHYNAAVQIADALLAKTGVEKPLQTGNSNGLVNEIYQWQLSVSPFQFTDENAEASLYRIKVSVSWGDANQIELITLKLANKSL